MKAVNYTYRIKADATAGTKAVDEALAALVTSGDILEAEFVRAAPAKADK